MNRIEVRGVIVPSDMDQDFMFSYIQRGIITPESIVRKAIANADPKKDIELYINSQGGSVFAGNEMINALQDWKASTGNKINVVVGAMAASMGSSILISVADKISVHSNSKIMFHGAWGGAIGGAESMKDYGELLSKINADIKVKLLSKFDLDADVVNEWFSEGREGWLNADEAKTIGMADEIIGEDAELPESANNIESMLNEKGMKIAALTLNKLKMEKTTMEKLMAKLKSMLGIKEDVSEESVFDLLDKIEVAQGILEVEEDNVCDEPTEESEVIEAEIVEDAPVESDGDEGDDGAEAEDGEVEDVVEEDVIDLNDACSELQETVNSLNEALNKKQSENDKLKSDIDKLASKCEKLLGNGLSFEVEEEAPSDWKSCVAKCGGDYVAARKQYADVYAKFMSK